MKRLENQVLTPKEFGELIDFTRRRLGIHEIALCEAIGMSPSTYSKIKKETV